MTKPLPATVEELPPVSEVLQRAGVSVASQDYRELFQAGDRMARALDGSILIFANGDLRRLGAQPAITGMPSEQNLDMLFRSQLPPDVTDEELGEVRDFFVNVITNLELPIHTAMKPVFSRAVSPKRVQALSATMNRLVRERAVELIGTGTFDHLHDFCSIVGINFWTEVLGITAEERERLLIALPGVGMAAGAMIRSRESLANSNAGLRDYFDILIGAMRRARSSGEGGFAGEMIARYEEMQAQGLTLPMSLEVCIAASLSDGFHTMAMGANNVAAALISRPECYARVRRDPSLVAAAVNEGLRLYAPLSLFHRYVAEEFVYDGLVLPKGQVLSMLWGAGNVDPAQYPDAGRYDLDRKPSPLTTFGTGSQLCPGRNLVNMMASAVVRLITDPAFEAKLEGDIAWTETPPVNAVNIAISTPVSLRVIA